MACGVRLVRCVFIFYILFLGVLSAATTIFAAWLLLELLGYSNFLSPSVVSGPPIATLLGGLVLLPLVVLIGCRAFSQKNHTLAVLFWVSVSVCGVLSLALGVWSMLLRAQLHDRLAVDLLQATPPAQRNDLEKAQWDHVQRSLQCCGVNGASDYLAAGALPMSCCDEVEHVCARTHTSGCLTVLAQYGATKLAQVALAAAIIAILMLIGIYAGCSYSNLLRRTPQISTISQPEDIPLTTKRKIFLKDQFNRP